MPDNAPDIPNVLAPPPLIYALPLLAGLPLHHFSPQAVLPQPGTYPQPWRPTTALVVRGPYRVSRNPMYLGFTLFCIGFSLWINTLWPLAVLPIVLAILNRGVILREEEYLDRREGYGSYRARVRCWL
jgi:protein-S-isoprenylcysteine O-methyltransferase Ste14